MMTGSRATQRGRVLQLLITARGDWVPLPKIAACAAQYNARILELRRLGFRIPLPRIEVVGGQRRTWYRIELGVQSDSVQQRLDAKPATLFSDDELKHTARWEDRG